MSCNCGCEKTSIKKWDVDELNVKSLCQEPKFSDLKVGDEVQIVGYGEGDSRYKSKLLSMGLVRGVTLKVMQVAPLGDPIEVSVLSYRLSLRKQEANVLKLKKV